MALNFPPQSESDSNPTDGQIWTSDEGYQWIYRNSIPGWEALAPTGNSNIVYRGGLRLDRDPDTQFSNIESGNEFIVIGSYNPVNNGFYPGIEGRDVREGQVVRFDGSQWQLGNAELPYATETSPGVVQLATRAEAITGTDNTRAMTPLRVQEAIPQATTILAGKTRYATKAETEAGTEGSAAVTPESLSILLGGLTGAIANVVPTGSIHWFPTPNEAFIPKGYMLCDGRRIYDTGDTAPLYKLLKSWGNTWGNGPASDVVRLPDLRGRFVRGYHFNNGLDPNNTQFGGTQNDEFKSHSHTVNDPGHHHDVLGARKSNFDAGRDRIIIDDFFDDNRPQVEEKGAMKTTTGITVKDSGGSETRPKNINLAPVIKL